MLKLEKTLSETSNFLRLINIIPDAIVIIGANGKIKYVNNATLEMFGYRQDELIEQEVEILMPGRFRSKHVQHRENYSKNPVTRLMGTGLELFGRRKDGSEFPLDIMLSPFYTDEDRFIISVIRDITERKKIEEELRRHARQLEDLVSAMTHDLKTPLIATEASYRHLKDGLFGKLNDKQGQIIDLLIQNNENTLKLVNSLLHVFKYESRSYKLLFEEIEIKQILDKAVGMVSSMIREKNIKLKLPQINFKFICDPFEIERVIINLLMNAVKYTPHQGQIQIKVVKNEEGNVTFIIEDNGLGVRKEELPNLFQRFWQSKRSHSSSASTGLGLYLSRQIVEAHGGRIWAESKEGQGMKVFFCIPERSLTNIAT